MSIAQRFVIMRLLVMHCALKVLTKSENLHENVQSATAFPRQKRHMRLKLLEFDFLASFFMGSGVLTGLTHPLLEAAASALRRAMSS